MTKMRRLDLVAIRGGVTAAIEVDKCNPLRRSYGKMLDLPEEILRVVVLRRPGPPQTILGVSGSPP